MFALHLLLSRSSCVFLSVMSDTSGHLCRGKIPWAVRESIYCAKLSWESLSMNRGIEKICDFERSLWFWTREKRTFCFSRRYKKIRGGVRWDRVGRKLRKRVKGQTLRVSVCVCAFTNMGVWMGLNGSCRRDRALVRKGKEACMRCCTVLLGPTGKSRTRFPLSLPAVLSWASWALHPSVSMWETSEGN